MLMSQRHGRVRLECSAQYDPGQRFSTVTAARQGRNSIAIHKVIVIASCIVDTDVPNIKCSPGSSRKSLYGPGLLNIDLVLTTGT